MKEEEPASQQGAWAGAPADLEGIPGKINIDHLVSPRRLKKRARAFLESHPEVLERAREKGKDIVALTSSYGGELLVGTGIAAVAIISGIVIYKHKHKKQESLPK